MANGLMIPPAPVAQPPVQGDLSGLTDEELAQKAQEWDANRLQNMSDEELAQKAQEWEGQQSVLSDVKQQVRPGIKEGLINMSMWPASLTDVAAQGAAKQGLLNPGQLKAVQDTVGPYTIGAMTKQWETPAEQMPPQSFAGKATRFGLGVLPGAVAGSVAGGIETPFQAAARAGGAGVGAASGEKVMDVLGSPQWGPLAELIGGGLGYRAAGGFPVAPEKVGQVERWTKAGGRVSAAQQSGSPWAASLEGGMRPDWDKHVSETLLNQVGIKFDPNKPGGLAGEVQDYGNKVRADANTLASKSYLPWDNNLKAALQQQVVNAQNVYQPQAVIDEINNAYKRLDNAAGQYKAGQLRGDDYVNLSREFKRSGNPYIKQMGYTLDEAMEKTPSGPQWKEANDNFGNYEGLAEAASRTTPELINHGIIDPKALVDTIRRPTKLKQLATDATGLSVYPKGLSDLGETVGALLASGEYAKGTGTNLSSGTGAVAQPGDSGLLMALFGVPRLINTGSKIIGKVGRTGPAQQLLRGWPMDPVQAAEALAGPQTNYLTQQFPALGPTPKQK